VGGAERVQANLSGFSLFHRGNRRSSHRFKGLPALSKLVSYFRSAYVFADHGTRSIFGDVVAKTTIAQLLTRITQIKGANGFTCQ
jgi:hypothetical protein